ncbi:metallophosphoesterase [Chlamydia pecorum]|uniref:metallophosphoesterase n=1 Tax=Chlamydia pecorum TaxID=85991 RepID=UPI0003D3FF12|nr:metallophosphoesterase [Chlamydia pecorum]ETF38788.1 phosphohydrolase [Chlamydia pecorum VR629]
MRIYSLADLHLSLGVPEKTMEVFGGPWLDYHAKIQRNWVATVSPQDVVLLPGDISWAMDLAQAEKDFAFLGKLPGMKYMIRGNHDYWSSASQVKISKALPPNVHYLSQGFSLLTSTLAIVGVRLWNYPEIRIDPPSFLETPYTERDEKIFLRELGRLERALAAVPEEVERIIVMTHYPPISSDGSPGPVSKLLEANGKVTTCVFGHLHNLPEGFQGFGEVRGIRYLLVAADYVDFSPQEIQ